MRFRDWIKNKKAELPGWSVVVMLIIGLFLLIVIFFVAFKSRDKILEWISILADFF